MTTDLPKHVAFIGDNSKYLSVYPIDGKTYLRFASDSTSGAAVTIEVISSEPDLVVQIRSDSAKYWKRDSTTDLILADTNHPSKTDNDTLFVMKKTGTENVYSLRNKGRIDKYFCARDANDSSETKDYLKVYAPDSTAPEVQLQVVQPH